MSFVESLGFPVSFFASIEQLSAIYTVMPAVRLKH